MESIINLKGVDRVRKRPLVFFQGLGIDGYKSAIKEIIKFAVEEIGKNERRNIVLDLLQENEIKVTIEGKGIELDKHYPEDDIYDWELIFNELYGRNKLIKTELPVDEFLSGLPNAFVCAVQFCCEYMDVRVIRKSREYKLHFEKGVNIGGLQSKKIKLDKESTEIKFKLDKDVLGEADILDAIEYFEILFDGCSMVANNICFILRFYKGKYVIERACRKGTRCR